MTNKIHKFPLPHLLVAVVTSIVVLSCSYCFILDTSTDISPVIQENNNASTEDTNALFIAFTQNLFISELSSNTLSLHYTLEEPDTFGIINNPVTFGSFDTSNNELLLAVENQMALLATFNYDDLTIDNQLTYDVLLDYLTQAKEGAVYYFFYEPLSPYTGLQSQLPILLSEFPIRTKNDIEIYLQLIESVAPYFDSLLSFQSEKANIGLFMSDSQLDSVIEDCSAFINIPDNYLLSTFISRIQTLDALTESEMANYIARNHNVVTESLMDSYASLISGLESLSGTNTNKQGLCYYENGRNYYAYLVGSNTGSSRSVAEISTLIKSQLQDDLLDLQDALLEEESTEGADFFDRYSTANEMVNYLETIMLDTFPLGAEVEAILKEVPAELEDYLSPAFYLLPAIDSTDGNVIYLNNAHLDDDLTLFTTLAHEGFPGHLYQTTYFYNTDPNPVRSILNYGGYVEGWATYTEMCSYYLTELPDACIYQKNASLMLGLYAYTDIGIHDEGWSLADTVKFYKTYGITDTTAISRIYDLILATPTNYLKYYVGYVEFLELKKDCIRTWGDEFSQVRFHKAVLDVGPVSFDTLRKYVLGE